MDGHRCGLRKVVNENYCGFYSLWECASGSCRCPGGRVGDCFLTR
ncbi:Hypothetical protein EPM1_1895 [Stenotrophomonas maltophilia EPM1]|nr:Hypothetical protein EPM1_1895 [Stenotrophomonas maltophilia EPM1]